VPVVKEASTGWVARHARSHAAITGRRSISDTNFPSEWFWTTRHA